MKALRHTIEYALVVLTMRAARALPWRVVRAMGTGLGLLFYLFDRRHRRIALAEPRGGISRASLAPSARRLSGRSSGTSAGCSSSC